jgi:hypothetical protein
LNSVQLSRSSLFKTGPGFNEGVDYVITLLRGMEKFPFADKESPHCAIVEMKEVRCDMNADFTEHLADSERLDVLPHSTVAEEECRWEAQQECKKVRPKKRGK